jgi:hypothetical protein
VGNVSFAGFTFDWDNSIFDFDAQSLTRDLPDVDNCFIGAIRDSTGFAASFFDRLDAIPDGGRVRVGLRPLTPRADGTPMYGRVCVRRPRIVPAHVTGTLYLTVTSPAALAVLRSTGCAGTILYSRAAGISRWQGSC